MRREAVIEETKHLFEKTSTDVTTVVEDFKKEFPPKIMLTIEPLLNAILTNNNMKSEDQEKLVTAIRDDIYVFYYMNNEVLIKLINDAASSNMVKKLKKLSIDVEDINLEEFKQLSKNQREIYQLRFDNLVNRYITFLINILS